MEGANPVNKKLAAALSGGSVLVLVLSGCGDDSSDRLNSWAKQVCDAVQPQAKKIEAANAAIQQQTSDDSTPADVNVNPPGRVPVATVKVGAGLPVAVNV